MAPVTLEQLQNLHTDLCYKYTVYKNRYKRFLDNSWIDSNGQFAIKDLALKDDVDKAYAIFKSAYDAYQIFKQEYERERSNT